MSQPGPDIMHLTKHHGLGNDFLVLIDLDDRRDLDADLARRLCDRRRGVGADGLIRVGAGLGDAEVTMALRNADGSRAEMSGNGIRCLGQAVARHRGTAPLDLVVATPGGLRNVHVEPGPPGDRWTAWVEVDMGPARPGPERTGSLPPMAGTRMATLDMGNPHLVVLVDDPAAVDLVELGPACQSSFPGGINVEVVSPVPEVPDTLDLRVWERGVGLTQACGTGACAAAHAAHEWGLVGERVGVRMPGGKVDVILGASLTLAGPATFVADIEVPA